MTRAEKAPLQRGPSEPPAAHTGAQPGKGTAQTPLWDADAFFNQAAICFSRIPSPASPSWD